MIYVHKTNLNTMLSCIYYGAVLGGTGSAQFKDIGFKTFGCCAAIATSSMVTEMAKGKTLEEALKLSNRQVAEALGGLPPIKMHCSNLAADALQAAVNDFRKKYHGNI